MGTTLGFLAVNVIGASLAVTGHFLAAAVVLAVGVLGMAAISMR